MKPFVAIGGVSDVVQHAETYYISVEATDDFCDQGSNFERYMTTKAAVCSVIIVCDHTANQTATCMVVLHTNVS